MDAKNPASSATPAKTAVLLIHGIGQQQPYETLDGFTRGLCKTISEKSGCKPTIRHDLIKIATKSDSWTDSRLHVSWKKEGNDKGQLPSELDLYEVCWAPLTQQRISYWQVLRFLQAAALSPLRYLATNLELISPERSKSDGRNGLIWVVLRELLRMAILYVPLFFLLLMVAALLPALLHPGQTLEQGMMILRNLLPQGIIPLALFYFEIILITLLVIVTKSMLDIAKTRDSINVKAEKKWGKWLSFSGIVILIFLSIKILLWDFAIGRMIIAIPVSIWVSLGGLLLFFLSKQVLVDFVGDIAIYVNMDENSEFFNTRAAILKEAAEKLRWLCKQTCYQKVMVAGHSLGSVVAHNSINRLLVENERSGNEPTDLTWDETGKIAALITFGSPLDKVYYFFRTHVKSDQAVRSQILSDRYPFARRQSRQTKIEPHLKESSWSRTYGGFTFEDPPSPRQLYPDQKAESQTFRWLNFWYGSDPVSGHLDFYDPTKLTNIKLNSSSWRFGRAHMDYWKDRVFYERVLDNINSGR